ncbi:MAG: DNA mismatch repair protein MutS [Rhodospirillaceae bacterium]|nr:DNA mismatch repair protein MutS [Rhodospirillaceae bacterium]
MLAHYLEVKRQHPDCLVFYRMGDFYELFFDDAVAGARALDLTLTSRGETVGGKPVPMAGVPAHAAEGYLARLIRAGFKVAVCEQVEDPAEAKKRGGKSMVRREVIRIVTPGTLTEEALLDARRNNYLAAVAEAEGQTALAWLDMTTGDFACEALARGALGAALARLEPGEVLVSEKLLEAEELFETFAAWKAQLSPLPGSRFDSENAKRRLAKLYDVQVLDGLGSFTRAEIAAAGALVDYVELTQKGRVPRLGRLARVAQSGTMEIDAATRRNLELTRSLAGEKKGSLLSVIDRSLTGAGARLLAARLAAPSTEPAAIAARLDMVAWFVDNAPPREAVRNALKRCPDIERALSRLALGRGGPRDLAALRDGLAETESLRKILGQPLLPPLPKGLHLAQRGLGQHLALVDRLNRALAESLPLLARDGGFIRLGYSPALDEQTTLRSEGRQLVAALEARYRTETDISGLKIRHNNVLGYYIEVTAAQAGKLPKEAGSPFIQRQSMANATRYTTVELSELEEKIARAADKALALELALFDDLVKEAMARAEAIAAAARAIAELDVAAALAELAVERRYCRPRVDDSKAFHIKGGRHPVVEALRPEDPFVPNDCDLAPERRLWLLTGPNMAGKSTFLRQNALIAIMAQIGSYVPAAEARIGVVDRLFSRVGAADDLARGRSTFMVEMVEAAAILHRAGDSALVILDEIGRGTATFDGLSIAWATVEHLHEVNRCRALFATHYHELTALAARLPALACRTMRVKEWEGEVVFLHEVAAGNADRSYGIHVARLAGLPPAAVARAEEVLAQLEAGEQSGRLATLADDLPLFSAAAKAPRRAGLREPSAAERELGRINPDELSPRAALEALYRLKSLADE